MGKWKRSKPHVLIIQFLRRVKAEKIDVTRRIASTDQL
jgi:hypothetical protein